MVLGWRREKRWENRESKIRLSQRECERNGRLFGAGLVYELRRWDISAHRGSLLRRLAPAQRIHHLFSLSQATAIEFLGSVDGRDVLSTDDEFAKLLLLFFTGERF